MGSIEKVRQHLNGGVVIPACPLALTSARKLDERRQRALVRYYLAAGVGGLAAAVHTTQFSIRDPKIGLFQPLLALVADELERSKLAELIRIVGICGETPQAVREASLGRELGYDMGLLSLGALTNTTENALLEHCNAIAQIIPLFGFYLQPAAGGRVLSYRFWRQFTEIEQVIAIKIAPFNRYQTLDVIRAVVESGRSDIALYTGNDDNIVMDLLMPFRFESQGKKITRHVVGGLLGHWAVWTKSAVDLHAQCRRVVQAGEPVLSNMLMNAVEITDANAAFFDAANNFAGCIPGIHEVLRRQGLLEGIWCLDPNEALSPGQSEEIDRVCRVYPHLSDDSFVAAHLDEWLRG